MGCKDIGIRKSEFVPNTQFLWIFFSISKNLSQIPEKLLACMLWTKMTRTTSNVLLMKTKYETLKQKKKNVEYGSDKGIVSL